MAITLGNSNVSIQSLGFRSMGFSDSRWRSRVVTPSIKHSEKKLVICSNQAENSGDLSTEEELEKIPLGLSRTSFPTRFFFGASTGAFQVEGSAFGGRGECIWTTFCKNHPEKIADGSNGEIACDSYHRYKEDVQLLADLGMDAYRFSISWPRILPNGRGKVNPEGIQYYKNLINELHDNGIEPFVTLFHWDVPQALEDEYGGFRDRKIVEDFKNYTKLCYEEFGDKVKHWITMNEPLIFSTLGYGDGVMAPGRCTQDPLNIYFPSRGDSLREPYIVSHNILLAHSEAVRLYKDEYQAKQRGKIGITLPTSWFEPYDNNPIDKEAQKRALEFNLGWFMDPLVFGNYPFSMRSLVMERLPAFSAAESRKLKGSYDFIGLNYYTARYARSVPFPAKLRTYNDDIYAKILIEKNGIPIEHAEPGSWINVYPRGLRELLLYIKERYNNPEIYITENGVMEKDENLSVSEAVVDPHRTEYHTLHLHELAEALRLEANVKGYFTWTLLDNFEWSSGYTSRLGLHYIDFSDKILKKNSDGKFIVPDRSRIKKNSALWFKRFLNIKRKTGMTFGPKIE